MSAERVSYTEDENHQCLSHLSQKPGDVNETRDSEACCSEDQEHTLPIPAEDPADESAEPIGPDDGATRHGPVTPNQAEEDISLTYPQPPTHVQNRQSLVRQGQTARGFVAMPPTPNRMNKLPDNWPPGRKFTWIQALEHNASLLDDRSLSRILKARRRHFPGIKGPKLVSAMAEYVWDSEDRLASLQTSCQSFEEHDKRSPGGTTDRVEGADVEEPPIPLDPLDEVLLEIRFYHCPDGFAVFTECAQQSGPGCQPVRSRYTSSRDPNYLIRVHFDWNKFATSPDQTLGAGDIPNAREIDVLSFMISSRPLAAFFERRLGLAVHSSPILKLGKPFRAVIFNYRHLKDHLTNLMSKYASGRDRKTDAHLRKHPGTSNCRSSSQQDVPPAALCSKDEQASEIFNQESALEHFRLLVQFIDQYLGDKVALFEDFQAGHAETVAFEDLWMLFNNGQKIVCPLRENRVAIDPCYPKPEMRNDKADGSSRYHLTRKRYVPQAYRVTAAFGVAPFLLSLVPKTVDSTRDKPDDDSEWQFYDGSPSTSIVITKAKQRLSPLHVACMYIEFDGTKYGPVMEIFIFKPFDGLVLIKTLEAYPLNLVRRSSNGLLRRGKKFIDITASPCHMNHAGTTIGEAKEECNGPVVVDLKLAFTEYQKDFPRGDSIIPTFNSFSNFGPSNFGPLNKTDIAGLFDHYYDTQTCLDSPYCYSRARGYDRYNTIQIDKQSKLQRRIREFLEEFETLPREKGDIDRFKESLENQDLIELLPGSVPGFSLRNRSWVQLNLDQLDFIEQQDDWNKLALPRGHREIVQAMVETHSVGSEKNERDAARNTFEMDLVRGKGNGCIILLHGVPGVGKTSTAECVASYTKRPLYSITCGDVGYEPEDVERNMGKHFKLAHRWGCVLLLDEADVFLAKRNKTDVKRNGLVSVFLRILEYYSGILFLTTNRVGAIDDAFRSRLHLTLYYPKLTETQTMRIWKTNIQRLEENNKIRVDAGGFPTDFNGKKITSWVRKYWQDMQWNGRQIRNAFQTAVALAEFEARQQDVKRPEGSSKTSPSLTTDHFKKLVHVSAQFSDYLRETHGDDEDERAVLEKIRAMPARKKVKENLFSKDESESDLVSDSGSCSESSGASESEGIFGSGTDSSDVEKKSRKKGRQTDGGRSHSSKKDKKGKGREDR